MKGFIGPTLVMAGMAALVIFALLAILSRQFGIGTSIVQAYWYVPVLAGAALSYYMTRMPVVAIMALIIITLLVR